MIKGTKKYVILTILLIVVLGAGVKGIDTYNKIKTTPTGTYVSNEVLFDDIERIVKGHGLHISEYTIIKKNSESYYRFFTDGTIGFGPDDNEVGSGHVIYVNTVKEFFTNPYRYTEVETAMHLWLYLKEHILDYEIDGISFSYQQIYSFPIEFYSTRIPCIVNISRQEFEILYSEVNTNRFTIHGKAKELADMYIKKTNYRRSNGYPNVEDGEIGKMIEKWFFRS